MTPCHSKYSRLGPEEQTANETRGRCSALCLQDHGAESDYQKLPFSERNSWRKKEDLNCLLYSVLSSSWLSQLCSVSDSIYLHEYAYFCHLSAICVAIWLESSKFTRAKVEPISDFLPESLFACMEFVSDFTE